jgi:hypothetical protein
LGVLPCDAVPLVARGCVAQALPSSITHTALALHTGHCIDPARAARLQCPRRKSSESGTAAVVHALPGCSRARRFLHCTRRTPALCAPLACNVACAARPGCGRASRFLCCTRRTPALYAPHSCIAAHHAALVPHTLYGSVAASSLRSRSTLVTATITARSSRGHRGTLVPQPPQRTRCPPPSIPRPAGVYGYPNFPADLPPHLQFWVDQALGSLDFALGDPDTTYWGGVRASMGRREPFALQWVSIGNEDCVHPFDKNLWQVRVPRGGGGSSVRFPS